MPSPAQGSSLGEDRALREEMGLWATARLVCERGSVKITVLSQGRECEGQLVIVKPFTCSVSNLVPKGARWATQEDTSGSRL